MERKPISSTIAGLILGLLVSACFIIFFYKGILFSENRLNVIPMGIIFISLMVFVIKYARDNYGNVTFGNCFGYGFKVTAVYTLILVAVTLTVALTNPSLKQQFLSVIEHGFKKSKDPNFNNEKQKNMLEVFSKFFYVIIIGGALIRNVIGGLLVTLIAAAVAKKNPNITPFEQQS